MVGPRGASRSGAWRPRSAGCVRSAAASWPGARGPALLRTRARPASTWSTRTSAPSAAGCSTGGAARWTTASARRCCATASARAGASAAAA
eukprot:8636088-Alexandrium_andersonii.AAC.1